MRRWLLPVLFVLSVAACSSGVVSSDVVEFWRPISEPNLLLPLAREQTKLNFDLNQCKCGIWPTNMTHADSVDFQPDKERLAETGVIVTPDKNGECIAQPSLVVSECMRGRGWEVTNCSGRMPLPGGGSLCTAYEYPH